MFSCKKGPPLIIVFLIFTMWLSSISLFAFAQTDLESKESRKNIIKYKIKEVKSYLWAEGGKPGDTVLVDQVFFNKDGLCIREITSDYLSRYYYNAKGLKTKDVSKSKVYGDESVTVFKYDKRGNMILSEKIKASGKDIFKDVLVKHLFTYNAENEILSETWIDRKGQIQIATKQEYLPTGPDSGFTKMIKYYNMHGQADRIQKIYTDGKIVMYNIGDKKNSVAYEQFLDDDNKVVKLIDYHHYGPHSFDNIEEYGHGIIATTTVTEFYKYNEFGLCSERSTYQDGKLIEKQTWHYLH